MADLPNTVCLKSVYNNCYLRYRYEDFQTHGLLQFSAESVMDPYAQFQVEKSNSCDGLVHLKSRFTNKYLVRWSPNHYWITAAANEPDENQGSWTCTLFKPIILEECGNTKKIRLLHVQLGHYASLWRIDAPFDSCLFAGSGHPDQDSCDVLTVVDWDSIFELPRRVAFKGDNGLCLGAQAFNGQNTLQFSHNNPYDPMAGHEIFPSPDGTIFIRSEYYGKFWRVGNENWIVADEDDPRGTDNANAMFRPSMVDINVVALLNMNPTWFCTRLSIGDGEGLLCANATSIDEGSRLEFIDLGN